MTIEGSYAALRLNQLECSRVTTLAVTDHRFGLVNFDFEGMVGVTIPRPGGTHYTRGLPVTLTVGNRTIKERSSQSKTRIISIAAS